MPNGSLTPQLRRESSTCNSMTAWQGGWSIADSTNRKSGPICENRNDVPSTGLLSTSHWWREMSTLQEKTMRVKFPGQGKIALAFLVMTSTGKGKSQKPRANGPVRIPMKSDTDSNNCRTPIPVQIGQ